MARTDPRYQRQRPRPASIRLAYPSKAHPKPMSGVTSRARRWLLHGHTAQGAHQREHAVAHKHPWWQVMCLTGVDYFSTLGYQPGIAVLAAGTLAPGATLILILLTLFGALPIYSWVARSSPHGEGSIAMLERLLGWWQGKLFVLTLLGFVATDFIITITLSAADATAHVVENPYTPAALTGHTVGVTLFLITLLCAIFLKGFKEAIGIAIVLVAVYLALNAIVIGVGIQQIVENPELVGDWKDLLYEEHGNPLMMLGVSLLLFPKLALGLSGFETGVAVMPLVKGDETDTEASPKGRIRNTRKLLMTAAVIMSGYLLTSAFVSTILIPSKQFEEGGEANGRALAFIAHEQLGNTFGTIYDISTICILWFAGASAMAGLLNIVPRYLPRYGMAPDWARATRPLVFVFTTIAFAVTFWFRADVDAQGGAYATGVLVLMSSAAIAVFLAARKKGKRSAIVAFATIALVFLYTTGVNIVERPDGVKIASIFIALIVGTSLVSRAYRSTELRATEVVLDDVAQRFLDKANYGELRIIANHPDERTSRAYLLKLREQRADNHIPANDPVLFLEVTIRDASEFSSVVRVTGEEIGGYHILRASGSAVPNTIAAVLLCLQEETGKRPHAYFGWTEGNPLKYLARFILFGEGDIAPLTHEILRKAEPDPDLRPAIHIG